MPRKLNPFARPGADPTTSTLNHAFDWNAPGNMLIDTINIGGMPVGRVLVASFTIPAGWVGLLNIGIAEFPSGAANACRRVVNVALNPGDFTPGWGRAGASTTFVSFDVGQDTKMGHNVIDAGKTYYVNIANVSNKGTGNLRLEIARQGK